MADRIQLRRDTAARWAEYNPVLLEGEMGIVTDNPNQYKIGDGVHAWNSLPLRGFDGTVTQGIGNDTGAVMSQKAVSDNVGFGEYPKFSNTENYSAGQVVNYEGALKRFKVDHTEENWSDEEVEDYSIKKEIDAKVINIVGFGTEGKSAGVKKVGEIYFNTETKLLRKAIESTLTTYITVFFDVNAIYIYNGFRLIWDGVFFDNIFCSSKRNGLNDYYKNIFTINNIGITNEGKQSINENYISTDYIYIDPELSAIQLTTYNSSGNIGGVSFYDENHNFISSNKNGLPFNGFGIVTIDTLRMPNNAHYYRVSIHKTFKDWAFVSHEYSQYQSREYPHVYNGGITINGDLDDSQKNSRYRTGLLYTKSKSIIFTSTNY